MDLLSKINLETVFYFILVFAVLLYVSIQTYQFFSWINNQKQIFRQNAAWLKSRNLTGNIADIMFYFFGLKKDYNVFNIISIHPNSDISDDNIEITTITIQFKFKEETITLELDKNDVHFVTDQNFKQPQIKFDFSDEYLSSTYPVIWDTWEKTSKEISIYEFLYSSVVTIYISPELAKKINEPLYQA